ncbi:MAG: ferritin family protein [Xanthomonadales bacterium]|nr:ferritin family protein [Xanthomonadales bacterium]
MSVADKIRDLDTFLAYSIALEEEAADRHEELADTMDVHNNPQVAATFRKLARYSRLHAQEVRNHATGRELPLIAPWDFAWETMEGPETADLGDVNYRMNTARALRIAMGNEQRAHDFYADISRHSAVPEIRAMAAEFAVEEKDHLDLLEAWMERVDESPDELVYDPDPPNQPD